MKNLFIVIFIITLLGLSSCKKQNIGNDNIDMFKSKADLQQVDTVILGFVGDYYRLNNQNIYIVKDNLKAGHADIEMTGTFTYKTNGDGSTSSGAPVKEACCEGAAKDCVDFGSFILVARER